MKKLLFVATAAALMTLASCKNNDSVSTLTLPVTAYNLITNTLDGGEPVVAWSVYRFNFDMVAGTTTMGTELPMGTGNISFVTGTMPFTTGMYQFENNYYQIINVEKLQAGTTSTQENITDLECQLTPMAYMPPQVQGAPAVSYPSDYRYSIMHYNIGAYRVRTFWSDMTFRGETTASYADKDGVQKSFLNKDMMYRVILNIKEKTATVVLYNVKLSEEVNQTVNNMVLEKLPVSFNASGIHVNGSDIVAKVYENGTATPNSEYTFDNFSCDIMGELTSASILYKIAGKNNGQFSGNWITKVGKE